MSSPIIRVALNEEHFRKLIGGEVLVVPTTYQEGVFFKDCEVRIILSDIGLEAMCKAVMECVPAPTTFKPCPACNGLGQVGVYGKACTLCHGTGKDPERSK